MHVQLLNMRSLKVHSTWKKDTRRICNDVIWSLITYVHNCTCNIFTPQIKGPIKGFIIHVYLIPGIQLSVH